MPFFAQGSQPSGFLQTPQMQQMMSQSSPDNQRFASDLFAYNDRQAGLQQSIAQGRGPRPRQTPQDLYAALVGQRGADGMPGGGLMTDSEAAWFQGQTGYMPNVTIGGNWNQRPMGRHPMAHLSTKQQKDILRIDSQAPGPQIPASTPMSRAQVDAFAGAIDPITGHARGLEQLPGGRTPLARGPSEAEPMGTPRYQALVEQGILEGPGAGGGLRASSGLRAQLMDRGLLPVAPTQQQLASNRSAYDTRRDADMAGRREAVTQRAGQRRDYRDFMQTPFGQFMGANPREAFGYQQQAQRLGIERQRVDQEGVAAFGRQAGEDHRGKMDFAANLIGALPAMVEGGILDQDTAQHLTQQALSDAIGLGGGMPQAPGQASGQAPTSAAAALKAAEKGKEWEGKKGAALVSALSVPLDAVAALGPNPPPSQLQAIANKYGLTPDVLRRAAEYYPWLGYRAPGDPRTEEFQDLPDAFESLQITALPWFLAGEGYDEFSQRRRRQSAARSLAEAIAQGS
jgi:hypothetical protein